MEELFSMRLSLPVVTHPSPRGTALPTGKLNLEFYWNPIGPKTGEMPVMRW